MDEKFDILKHPNIALTTDGKGKPYLHGEVTQAVASITLGDSLEERSQRRRQTQKAMNSCPMRI